MVFSTTELRVASPRSTLLHSPQGGAHASLTLLFPGFPSLGNPLPPRSSSTRHSPPGVPFLSALWRAPQECAQDSPPLDSVSPALRAHTPTIHDRDIYPKPQLPQAPIPNLLTSQSGFPSPSPSGVCSFPTPWSGLSVLHSKNQYWNSNIGSQPRPLGSGHLSMRFYIFSAESSGQALPQGLHPDIPAS